MKKIYYDKKRYTTVVKFQTEEGETKWIRNNHLSLAEAKRQYFSIKQNKGEKAHLIGNSWFYGHMPNCINGTVENILLEECRPFYFE